jgi:hypothetical protein
MARDHDRPGSGPLLSARLSGIALRYARWGGLTAAEQASAAAELRQVAGDSGDLLAEVAGLALGSAKEQGPGVRGERPGRGRAVPDGRCRRGFDPAVDRGRPPPGGGRQAAAIQPTGSCTTQTLSASGLASCWRGASSVALSTPERPYPGAPPSVSSSTTGSCEHRRLSVSPQVGSISGLGRPMVPMPPRSPTAFVITRGRCPGPYTRLLVTEATGRFRVSRQNVHSGSGCLSRPS